MSGVGKQQIPELVTLAGIDELIESKANPRGEFDKAQLAELAKSIDAVGLLSPLIVREVTDGKHSKLEIVAGARRFRALKSLKVLTVPCITRVLTDEEALEVSITENLQRADVHPIEEAEGYEALQKIDAANTTELIAARVGKSASYVYQRLKLLALVPQVRTAFRGGKIEAGHAVQIARLQPDQQTQLVKELQRYTEHPSVRTLAEIIKNLFHLQLKDAPFDTKDPELFHDAGACTTCPKRTGANKLLFEGELTVDDTCTDPKCYATKVKNFVQLEIGKYPEALKVSAGNRYNEKVIGVAEDDWRVVGKTKCKSTQQALVVQIDGVKTWGDKKGLTLGEVVNVCPNRKCNVHFKSYEHASGHTPHHAMPTKAQRQKAKLKELTTQAIHAATVAVIRAKPERIDDAVLRKTVLELIDDNQFKYRSPMIARSFGHAPEGRTPTMLGQDASKKLAKQFANAKYADLIAFLSVYPSMPFFSHETSGDLMTLAKGVGVNVARVTKTVASEFAAKIAAKAAPKSKEKKDARVLVEGIKWFVVAQSEGSTSYPWDVIEEVSSFIVASAVSKEIAQQLCDLMNSGRIAVTYDYKED